MRPALTIGADLIAGFPTESDAAHQNSLAIIDACDIGFGHIFPYSPRLGTAAARMPLVAADVARLRAGKLRAAVAARQDALLATMVGSTQAVLVERSGRRGHAPNFVTVDLDGPARPGVIASVAITGVGSGRLTGRAL